MALGVPPQGHLPSCIRVPLLIILCVYYLQQYRAKVAELALQVLAITATCLAAFNLFLALSARPMTTRVGSVAVFKNVPASQL